MIVENANRVTWTPHVKCDFSLNLFSHDSITAEHVLVNIPCDEFDQNETKAAENTGVNFIYAPQWSTQYPAPVFMKLVTTQYCGMKIFCDEFQTILPRNIESQMDIHLRSWGE